MLPPQRHFGLRTSRKLPVPQPMLLRGTQLLWKASSVLSRKFVHKFDAMHAGFPTVAAVYDRRFFLATCHKTGGHRPPLQWKNGPDYLSEFLTQDTSVRGSVGALWTTELFLPFRSPNPQCAERFHQPRPPPHFHPRLHRDSLSGNLLVRLEPLQEAGGPPPKFWLR